MTILIKKSKLRCGWRIWFRCDYCTKLCHQGLSHYKKKLRHFCSTKCYANYRKFVLPKEEQPAYQNGGMSTAEKLKRIKARSIINHAIRDGKVKRGQCEACHVNAGQAHHYDYNKPFKVKWLCLKCHWEEHRIIYENPKLLD